MAEFRVARVTEGMAVVSLMFRRRPLSALVATVAATAVTVGLTAGPGLADQVRDHEWWLGEIHVTQAWQVSRGAGVTVALLDTGVVASQPDLSRSVITGPDYTRSGRQQGDTYWGVHGTAMAVLIAGHGHGAGHADGIIGIAPKAKILSLRVNLERDDPLRADAAAASRLPAAIATGIRYAVRHGAQVIDLPLDPGAAGTDGIQAAAAAAGGSAAERRAVAYALARGVVLVAPAGDDGPGPGQVNYPAAYPGVIAVGAFDEGFAKAGFSSRRSYVTLTAPGEGVITVSYPTGYTTVSSTGAASAEVAGMAALIRARYPHLTPRQVSQALIDGARFGHTAGHKNGSGYGTADAQQALSAAKIEAASLPASSASGTAPPGGQHGSAAHRHAALLRDGIIVGIGLLLLVLLALVVWVRRRRHAPSEPPDAPRQAQPLAARTTEPSQDTAGDPQPGMAAAAQQRPQLAPVPKLDRARRGKQGNGPPWEPAPKPESEPPWGPPGLATNGNGITGGLPHPVQGLNGRGEATWQLASESGLPAARDPSAGPENGASAHPPGHPATRPGGEAFRVPPALRGDGMHYGVPPELSGGDAGFGAAGGAPNVAVPPAIVPPAIVPPATAPPATAPPATAPPATGPPATGPQVPEPPGRRGDTGDTAAHEQPASPIYVWNPGAKTEEFRAVSSGHPQAGDGKPLPRSLFPPGQDEMALGADTLAFPVIPPLDRGRYPDDDEDDRHL
jgi:Subtilase family